MFAFGIRFVANRAYSLSKPIWAISTVGQRKEKVMRLTADVPQQEKSDRNCCMVMKVWNRQRFGRAAEDYQLEQRDQIKSGWASDDINAELHARKTHFISSCVMPHAKKARMMRKRREFDDQPFIIGPWYSAPTREKRR
jgi:hypothetical protein